MTPLVRYLALDHGTKRIGVAVSDELCACFDPVPVADSHSNSNGRYG